MGGDHPHHGGEPRANWPICCPFLRQDILHDADGFGMKVVALLAYVQWFVFWGAALWNAFAMGAMLVLNLGLRYRIGMMLALMFLCVAPPLAYLNFRFLYNGWIPMFWCASFCKVLFQVFLARGIPEAGGSGFVIVYEVWDQSHLVGYFHMAAGFLWLLLAL